MRSMSHPAWSPLRASRTATSSTRFSALSRASTSRPTRGNPIDEPASDIATERLTSVERDDSIMTTNIDASDSASGASQPAFARRDPDARGYYGAYGGRFVPETLVAPVAELEAAYFEARQDEAFLGRLRALLRDFVGRPTPLYEARRLTESLGGARIFLKREDL